MKDEPAKTKKGAGPYPPFASDHQRSLHRQVFETIRSNGFIPRVQVAKKLGVSPGSITPITSELITSGLVEETITPRDISTPKGRPAVALGIKASVCYVIGVKISDTEQTAILVDFSGRLISQIALSRAPTTMSLEKILTTIDKLISQLCQKAKINRTEITGIGIGIPGFIDRDEGIVLWSSLIDERNVSLASAVSNRFGIPVWIDNDANLLALAELWYGAGRSLSNFAVITVEHGVGIGFVMNHRLYRGSHNMGMELGHIKVELNGTPCRCGQRGCLEAYVADYALAQKAIYELNWQHQSKNPPKAILAALFKEAQSGNPKAKALLHQARSYLAMGLANIINLLDPALIIFSGERMRHHHLYETETFAKLNNLIIQTGRPFPKVEVHAWEKLLWAHGAAALALSEISERLLTLSIDGTPQYARNRA